MFKRLLGFAVVLLFSLLVAQPASAFSFHATPNYAEVRSDVNYANSIVASQNSYIGIRATINLSITGTDYYGSPSNATVYSYAKIFGYSRTSGWVLHSTTSTQSRTMGVFTNEYFNWGSAFQIGDYNQYRIEVFARAEGESDSNAAIAFVTTQGYSALCPSLTIEAENKSMEKNSVAYFSFWLRNDSMKRFYVEEFSAYTNEPDLSVENRYFDTSINGNSKGELRILAISGSRLINGALAVLRVRGHFEDGNNCGFNDLNKSIRISVGTGSTGGTGEGALPYCDQIRAETNTVALNAGDTETRTFFIFNSGPRNFFIDDLNVSDNSSAFNATLNDFSNLAKPGERAAVNVKIQAYPSDAENSGWGYLRFRGHFSDYTVCALDVNHKKDFAVFVKPMASSITGYSVATGTASGKVVLVSSPETISFSGRTFFGVTIRNDATAARNIFVGVRGLPSSWIAEQTTYLLKAGETRTIYLDIDSRGSTGEFNAIVFAGAPSNTVEAPLKLKVGAIGAVSVEATASEQLNNVFAVEAKLKNNTYNRISGKVSLDVPSAWRIDGNNAVDLPAGEEKKLLLFVVPNEPVTKEIVSMAVFTASDGAQYKSAFSIKPAAGIVIGGAFGSAMAWVAQNPLVGLIILIVIIVVAALLSEDYYYRHRKKQLWQK